MTKVTSRPPVSPDTNISKGRVSPSMSTTSPGSSRPSSPNVITRSPTTSTTSPTTGGAAAGGKTTLSPTSSPGTAGRPPLPKTPSSFSLSPSTARLVSHMKDLSVNEPLPSDVPMNSSPAQMSPKSNASSSGTSSGTMSSSGSSLPCWTTNNPTGNNNNNNNNTNTKSTVAAPPAIDTSVGTIGAIPPPKNASPSSEAAHAAALALANRLKRTREDVIAVTTPPAGNHSNIFVKYLPADLDDSALCKLFSPFGSIKSCKVMVDHQTGHSLGYGFVRYTAQSEAKQAIAGMNGYQMGSKTLLCKFSNTTPEAKIQEPSPNLYIKPLLPTTREADLHRVFSRYGAITEAKVMIDKTTKQSRQIGFVRFATQEAATKALESMSGARIAPHAAPLLIKYAESDRSKTERKARRAASPPPPTSNPSAVSPAPPASGPPPPMASGPQRPPSVTIPSDNAAPGGQQPVMAYQLAVPSPGPWMHPGQGHHHPMMAYPTTPSGEPYGYGMSPMVIYPGGYPLAMSPPGSAPHHFALPSPAPYHGPQSPMDTPQSATAWEEGTNLFVFHLPSTMKDDGLHDLFTRFGNIESVKVVTDRSSGESKGYGFVKFARAVDAMTALNQMNGFSVEGKHLKVSLKTPTSRGGPETPSSAMGYLPQHQMPYMAYPMSPYTGNAPHQGAPMQVPYGAMAVPVMTMPPTPTMASSPRSTQSFSAWSASSPRDISPDSVGTSSFAPSLTTDEGDKESPRSNASGSISGSSGRSKQIYRPPPVQAREAAAAARAASPPPTMYTMVPVQMMVPQAQAVAAAAPPATTTTSSSKPATS